MSAAPPGAVRQQLFKTFRAEGLSAPPETRIAHHFGHAIINGDCAGIRFHGQAISDIAVRHAVFVAIDCSRRSLWTSASVVSR